jgi:hypothetical protein
MVGEAVLINRRPYTKKPRDVVPKAQKSLIGYLGGVERTAQRAYAKEDKDVTSLHQADALGRTGGVYSPFSVAVKTVTRNASVSLSSEMTVVTTALAGPVSSSKEDITEEGIVEQNMSEKPSSNRLNGDYEIRSKGSVKKYVP